MKKTFKSSKEQYIQLHSNLNSFYQDIIDSGRCKDIITPVEEMEVDENEDITFTLDEIVLDLPDFKQFEDRLVNV